MKINDALLEAYKTTNKQEAKILLGHLINRSPLELYNLLDEELSEDITNQYFTMINKLSKNYPLQYILGNVNVYGYTFNVNENVLIPRFETEQLIEKTQRLIKSHFDSNIKILDLCTGSGVIAITLKKLFPDSDVTAVDISEEALKVAKENAQLNNTDITFIKSDLFSNVNNKYDVIISNPPYIGSNDLVDEKVYKNEPHLALYGNNEGLEYFEKIIKQIPNYVNEKYIIGFEHGNKQQTQINNLILSNLNDVKTILDKDLNDQDRFIFIIKK